MEHIELKDILNDQKKSLKLEIEKYPPITRESHGELQSLLSSKLIKVIMGVRRSGKSTLCLLQQNLDQVAYVNFDDERLYEMKTKDLDVIYQVLLEINPNPSIYIFDEIQNIPGWELFLNRLQRKKLNILITGSNGKLLSRDLATHLTGRQVSTELFPFSCSEFFEFHKINKEKLLNPSTEDKSEIFQLSSEYLLNGGFPEVVMGEPAGPYLRELFNRIIGRDILQRYSLKSAKALTELAIYLVQNSGSIVSFQKLTKAFGFKSVHTLKTYFSYLQDSYLILEVLHFSNKTKERFTLPRKVYAVDTGMNRALSLKPNSEIGTNLETAVYLQLRRKSKEIYYVRSSHHEVDFVVCEMGKPIQLIQSCWSISDASTKDREFKALIYFADQLKVKDLIIVTWDRNEIIELENKKIRIIPFWKFCIK